MQEIFETIPGTRNEISQYGTIRNKKTKRQTYLYIKKAKTHHNNGVVYQLDDNLKIVDTHPTAADAQRKLGMPGIYVYLKNGDMYRGFYWVYEAEYKKLFNL